MLARIRRLLRRATPQERRERLLEAHWREMNRLRDLHVRGKLDAAAYREALAANDARYAAGE